MEYWWTLILLQIIPICFYIYYKLNKSNQYWTKRGVKGPVPTLLFGNLLQLGSIGQIVAEKLWLEKFGKIYGIYVMGKPVLTINDANLIKQVLVKDFFAFVNRDVQPYKHEIWSSNLFNAEDEQWKRTRAIISPSFTSGKLKGMTAMMNRCVDKLGDYFERVIATNGGHLNIKEVITGFSVDVIASTSFATDINVHDRSKKNPFLENAVKLFDFKIWRFVSLFLLPDRFNRLIGNSIGLSDGRFNFFRDLSRAIIRQRKVDDITSTRTKRNDIVQLMMDAYVYEDKLKSTDVSKLTVTGDNDDQEQEEFKVTRNLTKKTKLTDNEIIAQCILFFAAGFETTATNLSNALYNLAIHPEVQSRLFEEIEKALDGVDEKSPEYYDIVMNQIPYLEACIKETLRLSPPVTRLQRRVGVHNYKLDGIPLEKDVEVNIGVLAVHLTPEYYPEPERFNPDRFLPQNKHLLVPYTFLPFGDGPRNCMGMRFAYQEIKLCLTKILRQFQFDRTAETKVPLDYDKIGFMTCKNIPLQVRKR